MDGMMHLMFLNIAGFHKMSKVNAELSKYGLKLSGKQIIADNKHNDLTLKFIQSLLEKADQAEQQLN